MGKIRIRKDTLFLLAIIMCLVLANIDSFGAILIKFILEVAIMFGMWAIIEAFNFISNIKPKRNSGVEYDKRPIIEQLDEALGKKVGK